MPQCIVFGCNQQQQKGISMFSFPNKKLCPSRYKQWDIACGNVNIRHTKTPRVCSKHFAESSYDASYLLNLKIFGNTDKFVPKLSSIALPTLYLPKQQKEHFEYPAAKRQKRTGKSSTGTTINNLVCSNTISETSDDIHMHAVGIPLISFTDPTRTFKSCATQCDLGSDNMSAFTFFKNIEQSVASDTDEEIKKNLSDYIPSEDSESSVSPAENNSKQVKPLKYPDGYFLVSVQCMKKLFVRCQVCGSDVEDYKMWSTGTMCSVRFTCTSPPCKSYTWTSQIVSNKQPVGNVLVPTAAALCGLSVATLIQFAETLHLHMISSPIFYKMMNKYIEPVVGETYKCQQQEIFEDILEKGSVRLAGDGQYDSPGYSADKCTYTLQDVDTSLIVAFIVKTKDMVTGDLEKAAFLEVFSDITKKLPVTVFASDRHCAIRSIMKTKYSEIKHVFDLWHVVKSLKKKIKPLCAKYESLAAWQSSISNHLWWSAMSSEGSGALVVEKFRSILYHIINEHQWKGDKESLFTMCEHATLPSLNRKLWLKPSDEAYAALHKVVCSPYLTKDLGQVSENIHTGELESFHSLCNKYMPKRISYSYKGVVLRRQLAVLDHNSGVGRECVKYVLVWSKVSGQWVNKKVYSKKENHWREELMNKVFHCITTQNIPQTSFVDPKTTSRHESSRPNREEALASHR